MLLKSITTFAAALSLTAVTVNAAPPAAQGPVDAQAYQAAVAKAIEFLQTKGQAADGSYSSGAGIGVTALVTTARLRHGDSPLDPAVAKSLTYLESFVQDDGGIYVPNTFYRNYETCLSIMCFNQANRDGRYDDVLNGADKYLKNIQWDEGESKDASDYAYGGAGYGRHKRPDLSNTTFLIEALRTTGNDADSEAIQKALIFVSRCQNFESEKNTAPFAAKNPDGGFYYSVAAGGTSPAGETDNGGLRSYGSMTYAGLKSMLYAGVGPDDPRVKAAVDWIRRYYGLKENPGLGTGSLYYYYHTFAKTLDALGKNEFVDAKGQPHNWRTELLAELLRRQQDDGSWVNDDKRWLEGDAHLATSYALLALAYCRPDRKAGKP